MEIKLIINLNIVQNIVLLEIGNLKHTHICVTLIKGERHTHIKFYKDLQSERHYMRRKKQILR